MTSTNKLRKETRKNEKKQVKLKAADDRETPNKLADKNKINFFKYNENKTGQENSPMKSKRDADKNHRQEDILEIRNVRLKRIEDN